MGLKDAATNIAVKEGIKYLKKDFDKNSIVLIDKALKKYKEGVTNRALLRLREGLLRPGNEWAKFFKKLIVDTDDSVLENVIPAILSVLFRSYEQRLKSIEKYNCNVPWAILVDITTACNLKCTGCWASEYDRSSQLTYDDLTKIINEGKALGTYMYLYTGGEPLMRKKDLIRLCEDHPDCLFLSFTNGTLCDDAFADELKRVGNLFLAFSIEGFEETTDARRGKGTYKAVLEGMARLRERGVPFGASICLTKYNSDVISSDEYIDFLVKQGVLFTWYFSFVPVGKGATSELCVTPEQRKFQYEQVRKWRYKEVRPIFTMDFFNDGEYVHGCVAAGKQYFHISPNGDCEPCVFAHYSTVNVKTQSILEALQSPLFMAYRERQPFSDNMLRPCPVLDNPGAIKKIVEETGAHSTDLSAPEEVGELFAKTVDGAKLWKETADKLVEEHGVKLGALRTMRIYEDIEENAVRDFDEFG